MSSDADIYKHQNFGNPLGLGDKVALLIVDFVNGFDDADQFGGGNGKTALTIAGALAGASIVSNASNPDHHRNTYRGDTYRQAERCTVVHDVQNIETIDGYLVTYLYRGKRFTRTMAEAPGSTVRIRVQVEPVNDAYASNVLLSSKNHF